MKQINNIKFYDTADNRVKVVYEDGFVEYFTKEYGDYLYNRYYDEKAIDKMLIETLEENGTNLEKLHFASYKDLNRYYMAFRDKLKKKDLFLYERMETPMLKLNIKGNPDVYAWAAIISLWKRDWHKSIMTVKEILKYLDDNPNIDVYIYTFVGIGAQMTNRKFLIDTDFLNFVPLKSDARIAVLKDDKGNMLFLESGIHWD